jgi:hypothetical protein
MDEQKYLAAKRTYHNAHSHHESLIAKQRKALKQINRYRTEMGQQESKLQAINERLVSAVEKLRLAKEVYGPLRAEHKLLNPKNEAARKGVAATANGD